MVTNDCLQPIQCSTRAASAERCSDAGVHGISRSELIQLVSEAGGVLVDAPGAAGVAHHSGSLYILVGGAHVQEAHQMAVSHKAATVVRAEWLIQCMSRMKLLHTARFELR